MDRSPAVMVLVTLLGIVLFAGPLPLEASPSCSCVYYNQ